MNCAEKLLEPTILFNLYTKSPQKSGSASPLRMRDLSPTWNFEIKINHSIVYKILKMFCEVYDTDSLV